MIELRVTPLLASVLLMLGALSAPFGVHAQHEHASSDLVMSVAPEFPLMEAVTGPYARPVTRANPAAQAYFDQGMQLLFAFTMTAAARSFEEAQRQDPACAMCYWGEAMARGPFLNGGLSPSNAGPAYEAAQRALELIEAEPDTASPVEHALIQAVAERYEAEHDPDRRSALDSAYARAMEDAYLAHSDDADVVTFYAEALLILGPFRGTFRLGDPHVERVHELLREALRVDPDHPGACHLYIHATEATENPALAEECADRLGTAIPGASHINHMPSHTYVNIGRWGSSVRGNLRAWHSDQRAAWGEGVSYAANHNLHMLLFAASMDGQGGVAALAAREYAKAVPGGEFYEALVHLRFGWFEELLRLPGPPEQPLPRGLWEFARGYAHLKAGDPDSAATYLARVEEGARTHGDDVTMRGHTAGDLLGITGHILAAELFLEEGREEEAVARLWDAVEIEDGLRYDEPEPLNFSARHWLGAVLLEAGRHGEAEAVYRGSLERHPHNGWSLFGLEQAIRAQGRDGEADAVRERFEVAWERADTLIRSSRF